MTMIGSNMMRERARLSDDIELEDRPAVYMCKSKGLAQMEICATNRRRRTRRTEK